ncbi:MAG: PIG-L family deacetylase [Filimonas sp.]|nr:PIG-L family deacetylase [Filimonas sp.]
MRKLVSFALGIILSLYTIVSTAQTPATYSSADIYLQLKKLNVLGSVLYIAAHPDDENNAFLPYLAKEKLYRTAYLSLTRGDGGQNLIGSEQGIELGMIRTQELLAARRMDGAEQYFSTAFEFGYSKSFNEALRIWDKEKILGDVVWMIRQYQPDIIITRFPMDARAGHGHHSASAILANEAFKAAADPNRFPEQLKKGVKVWQAKRILWNTFNFGNTNTTSEDQLKINIGEYNNLLGKSYGEIGAEARSMHKSQGEGRPRRRGEAYEYFATTGGDAPKTDLMDGIVTDWKRVKGGEKIQAMINAIMGNFKIEQPQQSVPALVKLYQAIKQLEDGYWRNQKLAEVQSIIENCAGLFVDATTTQECALTGDAVKVNCFINKRNDCNVQLKQVTIDGVTVPKAEALQTGINYQYNLDVTIHEPASTTQPYWLQQPQKPGNFEVASQELVGLAWNKPLWNASFVIEIEGETFTVNRAVQYKYTDAAKGELYQPFVVCPQVSIIVNPGVVLMNVKPVDRKDMPEMPVMHISYKPSFTMKGIPVSLYIKQNGSTKAVFENEAKDFEKDKLYNIDVPVANYYNKEHGNVLSVLMKIKVDGKEYTFNEFFKTISYDHIPTIHYFVPNNVKLISDEVKTAGKKVGYITGAGDMVPDALVQAGYDVTLLSDKDLTEGNLKQFDAIITGVRAYNLFDYLTNKYDIMMRYVQNGGNLIVQYNRNNQVGSARAKIGPYPFTINSGSRVTEEDAKVNFLLPSHSVLNYPNKITDKDFEGWVQERSTYQAEQVDSHYEAPLGMNDTGEKQSSGSLLIAPYGKGNFVYASLVFFRQLPAGNVGAYKLMANLVGLPQHKSN